MKIARSVLGVGWFVLAAGGCGGAATGTVAYATAPAPGVAYAQEGSANLAGNYSGRDWTTVTITSPFPVGPQTRSRNLDVTVEDDGGPNVRLTMQGPQDAPCVIMAQRTGGVVSVNPGQQCNSTQPEGVFTLTTTAGTVSMGHRGVTLDFQGDVRANVTFGSNTIPVAGTAVYRFHGARR
jgi:hypothetical protein